MGAGFHVVWVILAVLFLATARRFRRHEEWLVLYRMGKTSKENIRGSWSAYPYQYEIGDWIVFSAIPLVDRYVRVTGELQEAWAGVRDVLPFGVKVDRPTVATATGAWVIRARGWDEEAADVHSIDVEASGLSEVAALRELADRLRAAATSRRRTVRFLPADPGEDDGPASDPAAWWLLGAWLDRVRERRECPFEDVALVECDVTCIDDPDERGGETLVGALTGQRQRFGPRPSSRLARPLPETGRRRFSPARDTLNVTEVLTGRLTDRGRVSRSCTAIPSTGPPSLEPRSGSPKMDSGSRRRKRCDH